MLWIVLVVIVALAVALAAWVRLAPVDPARWHADLTDPGAVPPFKAGFCPEAGARTVFAPEDVARLHAIALATPRTAVLAGSPETGHVTYITRSRLMAYPDFTTVQVVDGRLCAIAQQGMGREDFGVNAARLGGWLQELGGLNEPPDLRWTP